MQVAFEQATSALAGTAPINRAVPQSTRFEAKFAALYTQLTALIDS